MKKITAFLLAVTTCVSMGATLVACGGGDASSSSSSGSSDGSSSGAEVKTTVTETEWSASFNWGTNWTVSYTQVSPEMGSNSGEYKRDGNKISEMSTYTDSTGTRTSTNYSELVDGKVYKYIPNYSDGGFVGHEKVEWDGTFDEYVLDSQAELIPDELRVYSEYAYNETAKTYELSASKIVYNATVEYVKVSFADGKIDKVEYKVVAEKYSLVSSLTITYGGASVTIPTIEEPEASEMTAEKWVAIMGISNGNFRLVQNFKMGETVVQSIETVKFEDDLKVLGAAAGSATEYYIEKNGDNYYRYGLSNNTWTKSELNKDDYDRQVDSFNFNLMFGFSNFTYNEKTGTYDCALLEKVGVFGDTDVQNVSVTITNEKLTKVVWDMDMMGDTVTVECIVSYDNLTFKFPEINV